MQALLTGVNGGSAAIPHRKIEGMGVGGKYGKVSIRFPVSPYNHKKSRSRRLRQKILFFPKSRAFMWASIIPPPRDRSICSIRKVIAQQKHVCMFVAMFSTACNSFLNIPLQTWVLFENGTSRILNALYSPPAQEIPNADPTGTRKSWIPGPWESSSHCFVEIYEQARH